MTDCPERELYHADDAIVHDADEFTIDAFVYLCLPFLLDATYALSLDVYLVGQGLRAENAPSRTIVVELLLEEAPTRLQYGSAL